MSTPGESTPCAERRLILLPDLGKIVLPRAPLIEIHNLRNRQNLFGTQCQLVTECVVLIFKAGAMMLRDESRAEINPQNPRPQFKPNPHSNVPRLPFKPW